MVLDDESALTVLDAVGTAEGAVRAYREHRPDVVLMDINLGAGERSGIDAIKDIRGYDPDARIMVLTTAAPGPGLRRALEAGALGTIAKSSPPRELIRIIMQVAAAKTPTRLPVSAQDLVISDGYEGYVAYGRLTPREIEVLRKLCAGLSYAAVAAELSVTEETVKTHAKELRRKLGVSTLQQLILTGIRLRYYTP